MKFNVNENVLIKTMWYGQRIKKRNNMKCYKKQKILKRTEKQMKI